MKYNYVLNIFTLLRYKKERKIGEEKSRPTFFSIFPDLYVIGLHLCASFFVFCVFFLIQKNWLELKKGIRH